MAIRTPYEFDQDPVTHPEGEKIISVADPIGSAAGSHTYYLTRRFQFAEGNYTIEVTADDAATVFVGTSQLNSRMVATPTLAEPDVAYLNIQQGDYRVDVVLQNLPAAPSPCYFTMIIRLGDQVVYASAADGWLLDDAPISDDDVPPAGDYRFNLPMFSVLPNWKDGITERLTWMTDVMGSETDAEQRRSVRRNARRSFEAAFLRQRSQRDRLDTFFVGVGSAEFMLPLWHEAVSMNEGIDMEAAGVVFPDGELQFREFREGDLVFVNNGDPDVFDILQVGDMSENQFAWAFPPPRAWPKGSRIYPMRQARILNAAPRMDNRTDTVSTARVQFDLTEPYDVDPSFGPMVGGLPYFGFTVDRAQPLSVDYGRKKYILDNQSGVPAVTDHGRFTTTLVQTKLRMIRRANAYRLRQFLQAARGQAVHFYAPTFMNDVEITDDIPASSTEVIIFPQGFRDYMLRPQPIRIQLAFQFENSSPNVYTTITNVSPIYKTDPDGTLSTPLQVVAEMFTVDPPLPAISKKSLRRVSFVTETRFSQDGFELFHPTNQQEVVDCSITLRQALNPRIGSPA